MWKQDFHATFFAGQTKPLTAWILRPRPQNREDFTNLPIFTIDSASTKDIDDAVHIEKLENGYRLGVHIADVSFYVRGGTDSDSDAYKRGTSIYFGNNVIPMLPQIFSNDVCSLNEKSRRLAFSCIMDMDKDGNVTNYRFVKSLIYSRVKGVYSEINAILAGEAMKKLKENMRKFTMKFSWEKSCMTYCAKSIFGVEVWILKAKRPTLFLMKQARR